MAPRVLIFGTGSIGATYAFILSRVLPPSKIVTVCRSNYDVASKSGLTINSTLWGQDQKCHPTVVRSVTDAVALSPEPFDYILVCSKAIPTSPSTPETIAPAVSKETTIVLIQNGIRIEEPYVEMFPNSPLLSAVVYLPVTQTSPGIIEHKEIELLHIGSYPSSLPTTAAEKLSALLISAGASSKVHQDVQFERWSKLLINASWNPICALTRSRDVQILRSSPQAGEFVREVMREIKAVANSLGYEGIDDELIEFQLKRASVRKLPGVEPSMLADALAGRRMEVGVIVGNVVHIAEERGVSVPLLSAINVLAMALDQRMG